MEHRILLVEDDRSLADAICAQMKLWALECTCAADFRAVMAEFARVQPHLVLMDVSLPYMSGYHWCAEIRKVSSVPVIFISYNNNYGLRRGSQPRLFPSQSRSC